MFPARQTISSLIAICVFAAVTTPKPAQKPEFVVGVNVVNPMRAKVPQQDALIEQLKAGHVRVIRCPLTADDKDIEFVKRVYAQGIKIEFQLSPRYPPNAPSRAYQPEEFPEMWGGHPLSFADPELSRVYFQSLLDKLDENGIVLVGLELGNEINWTAFNPEFPLPGKGMNFGLEDLYRDPEAKQVAKGYLQYLKILAVLKDVRDHSKLNQRTPIILAGLADSGEEGPRPKSKTDSVSINATIQFLRANGLDKLVDAYGIHTYPWEKNPERREMHLDKYVVTECRASNSGAGKPCWITEWGIANKDTSCPLDDSARAALVKEMMGDFRALEKQGRLIGLMYFAWDSDPWSKKVDAKSIYRCGALTEAGRIALTP